MRDNGIGFEPRYAQKIFGLFKRLYKDEFSGTGLGLAICQRIIERYSGRIWAEGSVDQGAIFSFALPAVEKEWRKIGGEKNNPGFIIGSSLRPR